ncbi:head-tail connector protein [Alcaligenaceae bacterium B3P038]|nr:head-tail connector protein [Alcaligenaceae bacterium B3P038]
MALVEMAQVKAHLRVDEDYPDDQLAIYVGAAEEQAQEFLNRRVYATAEMLAAAVLANIAGSDPMVVNDSIRAAILLILGHLHANREAVTSHQTYELPMGSRSLLWPFRVGLGV